MLIQPSPVHYARTPHGDIAYQTCGEGPLDLVLMNPMSRCIEALWDYPANAGLLRRLARCSRLIVFDRRGSGISDPLPANLAPTWEDWQEDLLTVLAHAGASSAALVAERDAAAAAILFAGNHPERVRALVLGNTSARFRVAPGYACGQNHQRSEQLSLQWEATWASERMVASTRQKLAEDPEYVRWVMRMQRLAYSPRRAGAEFRYIINFDARAVLSAVHAPTLILHRRDFMVVPLTHGRYLADHIAGARFEELPGADMDVLLPGDDQPLALIESFLTQAQLPAVGELAFTTLLRMRVVGAGQASAHLGGQRWQEVLDQATDIVCAALLAQQGHEIECLGGGFLLGFGGPARAVRFAVAVRQALRDRCRLELRAGVHVGECQRVGDALVGAAVDVCSGMMEIAEPGEVLVTSAATTLLAGAGVELRAIGTRQLAGTPGSWRLYTLEA